MKKLNVKLICRGVTVYAVYTREGRECVVCEYRTGCDWTDLTERVKASGDWSAFVASAARKIMKADPDARVSG